MTNVDLDSGGILAAVRADLRRLVHPSHAARLETRWGSLRWSRNSGTPSDNHATGAGADLVVNTRGICFAGSPEPPAAESSLAPPNTPDVEPAGLYTAAGLEYTELLAAAEAQLDELLDSEADGGAERPFFGSQGAAVRRVSMSHRSGAAFIWLCRGPVTRAVIARILSPNFANFTTGATTAPADGIPYLNTSKGEQSTADAMAAVAMAVGEGQSVAELRAAVAQAHANILAAATSAPPPPPALPAVGAVELRRRGGVAIRTAAAYRGLIEAHVRALMAQKQQGTGAAEGAEPVDEATVPRIVAAAAVFQLLEPKVEVKIDDELLTDSLKGPFVLYNCARCQQLLLAASTADLAAANFDLLADPTEWKLVVALAKLREEVLGAVSTLAGAGPNGGGRGGTVVAAHRVVQYALRTSELFSKFYSRVRVLPFNKSKAPKPRALARLRLCQAYAKVSVWWVGLSFAPNPFCVPDAATPPLTTLRWISMDACCPFPPR